MIWGCQLFKINMDFQCMNIYQKTSYFSPCITRISICSSQSYPRRLFCRRKPHRLHEPTLNQSTWHSANATSLSTTTPHQTTRLLPHNRPPHPIPTPDIHPASNRPAHSHNQDHRLTQPAPPPSTLSSPSHQPTPRPPAPASLSEPPSCSRNPAPPTIPACLRGVMRLRGS